MRILAFAAASLVAVAFATSGSASAETPFDLLPAHTVAAIRVRDPLRAVQALADVNPDEFAAMSFAVSGGAAAAGLDLSGEIVLALTLARDTATPLQPFVGGALDIPNIALLALLPGKDVNALARALLAAGYRRDSPAVAGAAVALTHARLPSLSLAQWAPGVIAATVRAPPLKDGDEVMGVSVCPSGCYVVAQEPDSIAVVEPKYWGSYNPGTRRESDLSYSHQRVHTRFLMPSGWVRENTGIEGLATLFAYNASVPPAPPKPAGEAAGSVAGTGGGAKAGGRLTEQLAPGLRGTLDNGAVSLLIQPLAAAHLLQPALGAVHAALPLARMALSLGLRGVLPGQPLSHATAAAAGAVLDTLAGAVLTAAEQTETIVLSVGPSTGFVTTAGAGATGSGSSSGAAVADANDKLAVAAAALAAALPAGFRIETAVAVRADAPLGRAVAAAPVSAPWEDLLAGLPAQSAIPRADYLLVTADAASRGTSLDSWLAQQFAEATAPHVAALEAEADASIFAQAALGALRGRDMLSSLAHTFEGAQIALLLPNQRLTDAPVDEAEVHGSSGSVAASALALFGASSPIASKGEAASILGAVALLAGNGTAAAAGVERWSDFIRESLMHVATHAQAPWAHLLTVTQESSARPALAAPAPAATTAEAAVTAGADVAAVPVEPAAQAAGHASESGAKTTGRRQDAAFAVSIDTAKLRVAFETWPDRTVAGNVQLERRVIRFNLTQQLGPWAAPVHVGSFYLDESWGVIPETGQCIVAGAVDDGTIAAFIDAARARAAASAASAGAASGASEGDAPSDSPFSDDAAAAVAQPPSTSAESASAGAGSSSGGYSTDPAIAAATRATHPRKTGATVVHLATIARALCRVLPFTGAGAGTAQPLLPPWLAPVCAASEAFLGASPPPVISSSAEGAVLRWRLALAMPGAQNVAAMLRAWSASPN